MQEVHFPVPLFDVPLVIEIFAPILGQFLLFLLPEEQQQQTYVEWKGQQIWENQLHLDVTACHPKDR